MLHLNSGFQLPRPADNVLTVLSFQECTDCYGCDSGFKYLRQVSPLFYLNITIAIRYSYYYGAHSVDTRSSKAVV